ncbi:MAG: nucleoside triphosphate pyrophosphohydrolase [Candidatus Brocadiia bacterium]
MSSGEAFEELVRIMHRLRSECPWDAQQTHDSLRAYLLEETYEVLDALDKRDYGELREELGDLLLQVVFQAEVASEEDLFSIQEVIEGISEKLVRRHPHVFAQADADSAQDVVHRWEHIKTCVEKKGSSLAGVPETLPALLKATRVLQKIRHSGADPLPPEDAARAAERWLKELHDCPAEDSERAERATGMVCLAVASLAKERSVNAEDALRRTLNRVADAFRKIEDKESGRKLPPEDRERIGRSLRRAAEGRAE